MRLLICGGGTGGHFYPALAVVHALRTRSPAPDLLYVGSPSGIERELAARASLAYGAVETGGLRGLAPRTMARNTLKIAQGLGQAWHLLRTFKPDALLTTGGYVAVPITLAAWLRRVPILIYLPDLEPGWAIRFLARAATRVAVSVEEAARYFPAARVVVTGYPVRPGLWNLDKDEAKRELGLDPSLKTLLVFGGSRGAHSINVALKQNLPALLELCQVVHVCGLLDENDLQQTRQALPETVRERYHLHAYLHDEMVWALGAADLVVARAGAATIGEFPAAGLPSILVPYPYAGQHQERNAAYLTRHGAAIRLDDAALARELLPSVERLLRDERTLVAMCDQARRLARPEAAQRIAHLLVGLSLVGSTD